MNINNEKIWYTRFNSLPLYSNFFLILFRMNINNKKSENKFGSSELIHYLCNMNIFNL